jgi:membrane associated rhomboid family serine protease
MVTASVGFHCPQCARQGRQKVYTARSLRQQADPMVTKVLIGINAVVFLLTAFGAGAVLTLRDEALVRFSTLGFRPFDPIDPGPGSIGVDAGEWYRLVTGGFMHANVMHIGFNMYLLWLLGKVLEPALGRLRFGLVYGVSLLAGSFGAILVDPLAFTVGASGAVFGLMGAMVVAQRAAGINVWQSGIGVLVLVNLLITFTISGISIGGHIGGLVGGALAGACLVELPSRLSTNRRDGLILGTALVVALGVACLVGAGWAAGTWLDPLFTDSLQERIS